MRGSVAGVERNYEQAELNYEWPERSYERTGTQLRT